MGGVKKLVAAGLEWNTELDATSYKDGVNALKPKAQSVGLRGLGSLRFRAEGLQG